MGVPGRPRAIERATSFEELSLQASRIRDHYYRRSLERGETPGADAKRDKEQEILDHLYTCRLEIERILAEFKVARGN